MNGDGNLSRPAGNWWTISRPYRLNVGRAGGARQGPGGRQSLGGR